MAAADIVHARLDPETRDILARLRRRTGLRDSELIRRALRALDASPKQKRGVQVIGLGKFESGVSDLGSNDAHLRGFGRR